MNKFSNPFIGNVFKITQTNHAFDNAIDAVGNTMDLYAVCDMRIDKNEHDGKSPWFRGYTYELEIRYVHARATKFGNVKRGEKIGTYFVPDDPFPDHLHISVRRAGVWLNFMEYLDRSLTLQLSSLFKPNEQFYKNWSTWADKTLVFQEGTAPKGKSITVQTGWGVSHLAKAAGYSDFGSEVRWTYLARLNGFNTWQDFQKEFESGRAIGKSYFVTSSEDKPEKPVEDNLYKVFDQKGVQLNEYKIESNAFKFWVEDRSRKVRYNNLDITKKFTDMANKLEERIKELEHRISKIETERSGLSQDLATQKELNAGLLKDNNNLKNEIDRLKLDIKHFQEKYRDYVLLTKSDEILLKSIKQFKLRIFLIKQKIRYFLNNIREKFTKRNSN